MKSKTQIGLKLIRKNVPHARFMRYVTGCNELSRFCRFALLMETIKCNRPLLFGCAYNLFTSINLSEQGMLASRAIHGHANEILGAMVCANFKLSECVSNNGSNLLHVAIACLNTFAVQTLLRLGCSLKRSNNDGMTPMDVFDKKKNDVIDGQINLNLRTIESYIRVHENADGAC